MGFLMLFFGTVVLAIGLLCLISIGAKQDFSGQLTTDTVSVFIFGTLMLGTGIFVIATALNTLFPSVILC